MDDRGFLFTSDLLLSLIIVTVAMGIAIGQFDALNYQMQDFTGRQSLDRTVNDAADYIIKTSGNPSNWNEIKPVISSSLPGLAYMSNIGPNNNYLNPKKMSILNSNPNLLYNLVHTQNYKLLITRADTGQKILEITSPNPTTSLANAKEVAVANRTVVIVTNQTAFSMNDLMHINPGHPSNDNGFIWFNKSGDSDYVGPGNVTTAQNVNSSFYISLETLEDYDFYIYIDENYATQGSPINVIKYGFTDGDAVVNGTYGPLDDKNRDTAISKELDAIYHPGGWQSLPDTDSGSLLLVNEDIKSALQYYNDPEGDLKFWVSVKSNPQATLSLSLVQVNKGQAPFQKIPAKLVLTVWE
ncbi:hypothetical protein [Methanobacterium oryzae]|uniref:hypothetical protein n=1 Tax=Methanobacterium oryzae TaxID=69540 RepID=UPI003D1CC58C